MEELFYLILIVVWLVISIYKRKTRQVPPAGQKGQEQQSRPAAPREKDLEDILGDFFGGGQKKPEAQQYEDEDTVVIETEPQPSASRPQEYYYEELQKQEPPAAFQQFDSMPEVPHDYEFSSQKAASIEDLIKLHARQDAQQKAIDEASYGKEEMDFMAEFDLKTAVVFSEILNRKYS